MSVLTREEQQFLPSFYANRWQPFFSSVGPPADPDSAFEAVKNLCRRAKRSVPRTARWVDSPSNPRDHLYYRYRCQRDHPCASCVLARLQYKARIAKLDWIRAPFERRRRDLVHAWNRLHGYPDDGLEGIAMAAYGWHPVEEDFARQDFARQFSLRRFPYVDDMRQVASQAFGWWLDGDIVYFIRRPDEIVRDRRGLIGCADGPAIKYADGGEIYAWRDQYIAKDIQPRELVRQAGRSFIDIVLDGGVDGYRASQAIDMYGVEKFLDQVPERSTSRVAHRHKRLVDDSKWGRLWEVTIGREARRYVEVWNSTEKDGDRSRHVLAVDPWCRPLGGAVHSIGECPATALQAIASTFGMMGSEYERVVQS